MDPIRSRRDRSRGYSCEDLPKEAQAIVDRGKAIPSQLQSWKKSAARVGSDIILSLVCIHWKGVEKEKLKNLRVVNRKSDKFEGFMEMFMAVSTWITDGIVLDTFVEAVEFSSSE